MNGPVGKEFLFFCLETLKNCILNEKFYPQMTTIRAFCSQIRVLFSNFRKRAGETCPPPPSSYAPASNIYTVFILYICAVRYTYPIDKWFRKPSKHGHYLLLCEVFTKDLYKGLKYKMQITEKLALHGRNSLE